MVKLKRYIDANIILYASVKRDERQLDDRTREIKERSKEILKRIKEGERVYISTIQVSESLNVIEKIGGFKIASIVMKFLLQSPQVMIITVTPEIMEKAAKIVDQYSENKIGFNDAIAYVSMLKKGCTEIYTFDKHFNLFKGIKRIEN